MLLKMVGKVKILLKLMAHKLNLNGSMIMVYGFISKTMENTQVMNGLEIIILNIGDIWHKMSGLNLTEIGII